MDVGPMELVLVLVLVVVLFGAGKVADLGGALGRSVREFRDAVKEDDEHPKEIAAPAAPAAPPASQTTWVSSPTPSGPPATASMDFVPGGRREGVSSDTAAGAPHGAGVA